MQINKKFTLYIFLSLTIFLGFALNENSSGGAKLDNEYLFPFIDNFSGSFLNGIDIFAKDKGALIHSPVFYFLIGNFLKFGDNLTIIKITFILISCTLPYLFYLVLKEKYQNNLTYLFYFSLIIFFSPYFRSSAIWLLGDNLSLIFFVLSIYFINKKKEKNQNFSNFLISLIFLSLCCYIRYYYCIFSIYYFWVFYKNLNIKKFCFLILIAFLLSSPAFIYLSYIINNYAFLERFTNYSSYNFYSNSLIILSIILFYLLPFLVVVRNQFKIYLKNNLNLIIISFLFFSSVLFLDYFFKNKILGFSELGGGVFIKIAQTANIDLPVFLSLVSFIAFLSLDFFFREKRFENYFLLFILILSFPILNIYQKYFDPLFFFFFFGLIKSNQITQFLNDNSKSLKILYTYFLSFYLFSLIYYL